MLAGFVLARASAGLADSTIRNDTGHLGLIRSWFGRPLWEMQPEDADAYFGKVLRNAKPSTRPGRAPALTVYFEFLELRLGRFGKLNVRYGKGSAGRGRSRGWSR